MMGPFWGPPADNPEIEKPKTIKGWIKFISKSFIETLQRLGYIYKLVWDLQPWILFLMGFMTLFNGVAPIVGSLITKRFIDDLSLAAIGQLEGGLKALLGVLIFQIVYELFCGLVNTVSNMVTRISNEVLAYSIKLKIMDKARTIDLSSFDMPEFYSKMENANREAGNRPLSVLQASFSIISSFISLIGYIIILGRLIQWAPPILIIMAIPTTITHYYYRKKMFKYFRRKSKERRQMDYYSSAIVDKDLVKEIKLFDLSGTFIQKYRQVFELYFKGIKSLIFAENYWGIGLSIVNGGINGFILYKIVSKIINGGGTVGDYSLYSGALFAISSRVSDIVNTSAGIYEGTLYIDNLIAFMEEEPKIVPSLPEPRKIERHISHVIEFRHVSFAYPGKTHMVLKDINLTINGGETVVLVGLNGAGKTTLLKLLTRLYDPTEGVILFDGHDIREYSVEEIYSVFGIIFQDFGKYAFTVGENIGFGQIERVNDSEGIVNAAEKSAASDFINALNDGYNTPLTRKFEENGLELSIGQWQKIAVARAFFRDSDIMILDEPTASLDPMAEQEIFSQFDRLRGNKSTIFVSHRLSSATIANKIVVLENGCVVEEGSHRELMNLNGKYAELFSTQAKRYIENINEDDMKNMNDFPPHGEGHGRPMPPFPPRE